MKIEIYKTVEIDIEAEKTRLRIGFKGKQLDRLMNCIELFEQFRFEESVQAYGLLPYDSEEGCTEREFLPMWYHDFFQDIFNDSKWRNVE